MLGGWGLPIPWPGARLETGLISPERFQGIVTPREREMFTGMGNCYEACRADYRETLEMVAGARHLTTEEVEATLARLRTLEGETPEYRKLRSRLPEHFPI
jgi:hypothetical protein